MIECRSADGSVQHEIHEVLYPAPNNYVPLSY